VPTLESRRPRQTVPLRRKCRKFARIIAGGKRLSLPLSRAGAESSHGKFTASRQLQFSVPSLLPILHCELPEKPGDNSGPRGGKIFGNFSRSPRHVGGVAKLLAPRTGL
jgi:hypothetical protein